MTAEDITSSTETACCGSDVRALSVTAANDLADQLTAVADPVRLRMLSIIANAPGDEVCACDFVDPIGKSQPTISHHLKVLTEAGLIVGDKRGRWIWYRIVPGRLDGLLSSLTTVTASS